MTSTSDTANTDCSRSQAIRHGRDGTKSASLFQMHKAIFILALIGGVAGAVPANGQDAPAQEPDAQSQRPKAIEYSDAYETRAKIHKYASYATLPLFATEVALGQSIYNDPNARN